jgi:hypothetical protein
MSTLSAIFQCRANWPWHGLVLVVVLALDGHAAQGASLFGDPTCQQWQGLGDREKRVWAHAFLAPLSLTLKGIQKHPEDTYNDDPKAAVTAVQKMDVFCASHPDMSAADAAVHHLKQLMGMPPK